MNAEDRKILTRQGNLIQEVHQAVLGVSGTDDKGLVGDVKELRQEKKAQDGTVSDHESRISTMEGAGGISWKAKAGGGLGIVGVVAWNVIMWFRQQPPS